MKRAFDLYGSTPRAHKNENADCCVRALAIAAGINYEQAHAMLKKHGRKDARRTPRSSVLLACCEAGLVVVPVESRPTLAQFIRSHRSGRYYLSRSGHAFALVNGVVHDWKASRTGPRSRIKTAFMLPVSPGVQFASKGE